jgi:predicted heme/steroid binding protein
MKLSRLALITLTLNIGTTLAAILAWTQAMNNRDISLIAIAGLLGLVAFSLMWVHFISDAIRDIWRPNETAGNQYLVTRWVILVAILLHPSLIVLYLYQNEYGLPPASYSAYVGDTKAPFVFLGALAITIFLAFECKRLLAKHGLWRYVLHANFLAMFAVAIHGFQLGNVMESRWYFTLWCLYATTLFAVAIWWYIRYYGTMNIRKIIAICIVSTLAIATGIAALQALPRNNSTPKTTTSRANQSSTMTETKQPSVKTITRAELVENNGKNGTKCWLAIDGVIYDASTSSEWANGQHTPSRGMASCGRDLTDVINQSPHGKSVLSDLPEIGILTQ